MLEASTTDPVLPVMSDAKRALLEKFLRGGGPQLSLESNVIARRAPDDPALPSFG